jgi:hypothetical protein
MKGVLHVHSTFSDGEESLEGLVRLFKQSGMNFAAVSDHAEVFDEARMSDYVALCEALSDSAFTVIPGLEFALKGGSIHILGYGITRRIRFATMEQLVDGIHDAGGVAVLAHPPAGSTNMIDSIKGKLDGIEVWNGRYDGIRAPRVDSFQLLRLVRSSNLKTSAFCGIDLHKTSQLKRPVYVEVSEQQRDRHSILAALRDGRFTLHGNSMSIPSSGDLTLIQELSIAVKQPFCRRRAA